MLESVLQLTGGDVPTLLAAAGAISAAIGLIYSGLSYRQSTKEKYVSDLKEFDAEITQIEESEESSKDYSIFLKKYLNCLDKLAFLALRNFLPSDIPFYFKYCYAKAMRNLEDPQYEKYKPGVEYLVEWCKKNKITGKTEGLRPRAMSKLTNG
jgi:hypothetical protein